MTVGLVSGVLCWVIAGLGPVQLAYWSFRRLRSDRPTVNAMAFVFLTMAAATLFALLMGLVGLLTPLPMAGVGAVIPILVWRLRPQDSLRSLWSDLVGFLRSTRVAWRSLPTWVRWLSGAGLVLGGLRFAFLIWALPPFVWDSLTYHLTNVAQWTQTGRIAVFNTSMLRIYSPANFEVLATWLTVFIHHDAFVEAAGLPSYILSVIAVYAIGRGLNFSRPSSWIAALAYGSTPALLLATTGTKNDPQVAAMYLVLIAIAVNLGRNSVRTDDGDPMNLVVLGLLTVLYAAGTKAYIAHLLPGVALILPFRRRESGPTRSWSDVLQGALRQLRHVDPGLRVSLAALLLAGITLGGYWNIRNWVETGNPFFPYGVTVGDRQVFASEDRTAHLGLDRLVANADNLRLKFGDRLGPVLPDLPNTTGWGWFAYGLGLPALVWALFRRPEIRPLFGGFVLSLVVLFLSDRPSPWNMRYVIWFPAIFAIAFAAYLDWIREGPSGYGKIVVGLLTVVLSLNFVMTINDGRVSPGDFQSMLGRSLWDREAADLRLTVPEEYSNALEFVPREAILGYSVTSNGFIYPLYRADLSQRLVYLPLTGDETCDEVAQSLEQHGTRYLFVAPEHSDDGLLSLLGRCAGSGTVIRERARGVYVVKEPD